MVRVLTVLSKRNFVISNSLLLKRQLDLGLVLHQACGGFLSELAQRPVPMGFRLRVVGASVYKEFLGALAHVSRGEGGVRSVEQSTSVAGPAVTSACSSYPLQGVIVKSFLVLFL